MTDKECTSEKSTKQLKCQDSPHAGKIRQNMDKYLINNLEFAESKRDLTGEIALKNLPRLLELLDAPLVNEAEHVVKFALSGAHAYDMPSLQLNVTAVMPMQCQRCLEALDVPMSLLYDYVLSDAEPTELEESDEVDWLEISQAMDLNALIEDELLIALPIAPTHAAGCQAQKMESGEKPNPFAVLKGKF